MKVKKGSKYYVIRWKFCKKRIQAIWLQLPELGRTQIYAFFRSNLFWLRFQILILQSASIRLFLPGFFTNDYFNKCYYSFSIFFVMGRVGWYYFSSQFFLFVIYTKWTVIYTKRTIIFTNGTQKCLKFSWTLRKKSRKKNCEEKLCHPTLPITKNMKKTIVTWGILLK